MKLKTTFKFYTADGGFVGAYKTGSLTQGEPVLMFNLDFLCEGLAEEKDKAEGFKDAMLQTLTHEFCHSMQEWLGKEFDEMEVEKILGAINERWNVFAGEQQPEDEEWIDQQVFKISDFLNWMNGSKAQTFQEFKDEVNELFKPVRLWIEAHEKHAASETP